MTTSKRPQIALIIMIQMALMVPIACLSGPNCDELAHLASGLYHWQTGRFDAYCVNPPLHRMWCTLPIAAAIPNIDWCAPSTATGYRLEWSLSHQLLDVVSPSTLRVYLVAARLMNLPPVMLGGIVCFLWSESRYGTHAGRAALVMWCFSPNVLSWGVGLCPGIAAASLGATACYCFGHWLNRDSWKLTLTSGFLLGLAVLTKATWILLLVTSPLIIVASRWLHGPQPRIRRGLVLLATGLLVIYLGYGLDRPWTRLADQTFQSQFFRDVRQNAMSLLPAPTLLFLPLPESLVVGMDQQKHDFEEGKWSFLCGKWRHGGWLTYYAICAGLKMPLGFWCLVAVALVVQLSSLQKRGCQLRAAACVPSLALYIPPIAVGLLVSSQTGFSRHFRYLFPCLPFAFVWAGQAAAVTHRSLRLVTFASLAWLTTSSLATWPLCHAYFNELAGGPGNGYRFLLDSNVDWGEDVLLAEDWIGQHPEARPAFRVFVTDEFAAHRTCPWLEAPETLIPGWYLASVHRVMDPSDRFTVLRQFTPVDRIGYSTFVFHLTADQIERTRVAFATDSSENHGSIRQFAWQTTTGNTAHDAIQENTHRTPELAIGRHLDPAVRSRRLAGHGAGQYLAHRALRRRI